MTPPNGLLGKVGLIPVACALLRNGTGMAGIFDCMAYQFGSVSTFSNGLVMDWHRFGFNVNAIASGIQLLYIPV